MENIRDQYLGSCDFQGGRKYPFRGYGDINFVIAARLFWTLFRHPNWGAITFEPYIMYNHDPEQRVEFTADANSHLATAGFAAEWKGGRFQGGFDFAHNFGRQQVVSYDRNTIVLGQLLDSKGKKTGTLAQRYTHILDKAPLDSKGNPVTNVQTVVASANNKDIVNVSPRQFNLNKKQLTVVNLSATGLFNATNRFRQGYENKYKGLMFVADAGYWVCPNELQLAGTVGFATGDENPNQNFNDPQDSDVDEEYNGFIGLQEVYSGKLVQSLFVLGARKLPRPLSVPTGNVTDRFATVVNEFTNLVFGGVGSHWRPANSKHRLFLRSNILLFGLEHATKKFDLKTKQTIDQDAAKFLGTELNSSLIMELLPDFRVFATGAVFIPGKHYKDILGKPIDSKQRKLLDLKDRTGFELIPIPLLGDDPAWFVNFGFQYNF